IPPLRIIVADDERDMREYLQEVLTRLGHQVVAVSTGQELVELCDATTPDLVITDIKMPQGDGLEAAVAIQQGGQPIPVILVSASHAADILTRLGSEPVMAYLVKPISEADLKTALTVASLRFQHFLALQKETANLRQALEDRKLLERAKGILMSRLRVDE